MGSGAVKSSALKGNTKRVNSIKFSSLNEKNIFKEDGANYYKIERDQFKLSSNVLDCMDKFNNFSREVESGNENLNKK